MPAMVDQGRGIRGVKGLTIFEQGRFGVAAMDEAAKLRNPSNAYVATWELFKLSAARIAMTATPIQNGPMVRTLRTCYRPEAAILIRYRIFI